MIIKYLHEGNWGYIDNITNVVNTSFSCKQMLVEFNKEVEQRERIVEHTDYPEDIENGKAIFLKASEMIKDTYDEYNCNTKNLLNYNKFLDFENGEYQSSVIVCNLKNREEYDKVCLVSNEKVYLLNDSGQTIERLI